MHSAQLNNALRNLAEAVRKVEEVLKEMQEERDPLALHIFVSRRGYRKIEDTKSVIPELLVIPTPLNVKLSSAANVPIVYALAPGLKMIPSTFTVSVKMKVWELVAKVAVSPGPLGMVGGVQ